jgi:phosphoglycolate phosphatase
MIKCAMFDFDGTLVDSNDIKFNAFFKVTRHIPNSKKIIEKVLQKQIGDRYAIFRYFAHAMYNEYEISVNAKTLSIDYTLLCEEEVSNAPHKEGFEESLKKLKLMNIKLFVSSATPQETLNNILIRRGVSQLFDGIFGTPDSKEFHIEKVKQLLSFSSSEILYIGDSEPDRLAAFNSNCHFIGIGLDSSRFSIKPTILLETLHDLPKSVSTLES